jgi:succinate dehydrogenase membrane anchor subunit
MLGGRYGTAHNGLGDWYIQRLSAVIVALLLPLLYVLLLLVYDGSLTQMQLLDLVDGHSGRMLQTLLLIAVLTHAYLGVKSIVEDYVHSVAMRIPLMGIVLTGIAGFGVWWLTVIWAWGS